MKLKSIFPTLFLSLLLPAASNLEYYLGNMDSYESEIPKPSDELGFEVGEWHVRHDQLLAYMRRLAEASDKATLQTIGRTHESRELVNLMISSPANLTRLEEIREAHVAAALGAKVEGMETLPVVVYLGYSIHGNEPSGSNASMLVAYHLLASPEASTWLDKAIIIIDPSLNPDGLSRFAQWANMHKGNVLVADDAHREHREHWPSGRTNHYWYDLNRDWLLLQHPESLARVKQFHRWRPNVLGDFHEMGTQASYFFQPGVPSRQNPLTPDRNLELTRAIAKYHAKALDLEGKPYFSEQQFDDFYYGKGSTYPDIQGGVGILFEQASSRGHLQTNSYGTLSFPQTIKNQLTTSMSTLRASIENREALISYQTGFFEKALEKASADPIKAYVFGDHGDPYRAREMAKLLNHHQIEVFELKEPYQIENKRFDKGFVVSTQQNQYLLIKSLFEEVTTFADQTFYDVSTWHFPSAFGLDYAAVSSKQFQKLSKGNAFSEEDEVKTSPNLPDEAIAFAIDWRHYLAPRYAYQLLAAGYRVRGATEAFSGDTPDGQVNFPAGTLIVHRGIQEKDGEALLRMLNELSDAGVPVHSILSGLTPEGHDLGSSSFVALPKPTVALVVGNGVSISNAGEMWHLLDFRFQIPVILLELDSIKTDHLKSISHLILVDGSYREISESQTEDLARWLLEGGTLIAQKRAAAWASEKGLAAISFINTNEAQKDSTKDETPARVPYGEQASRRAKELVSGTIFEADLDLTHPLGFGFSRDKIALFRTHSAMMQVSKDPYATVAAYTETPLKSGYVSAENLEKIKKTAALIAARKGRGAVIAIMDDPSFRGYWLGTQRFILNSLFFQGSIRSGSEREATHE